MASKLKSDYWIRWCSYSHREGGCRTHACEEGSKAVCGITMTDGAFDTLEDVPSVSCQRCMAILRKRGVITEPAESGDTQRS